MKAKGKIKNLYQNPKRNYRHRFIKWESYGIKKHNIYTYIYIYTQDIFSRKIQYKQFKKIIILWEAIADARRAEMLINRCKYSGNYEMER